MFVKFDALMGQFYNIVANLVGISIGLFAVTISLDLILRLANLGNLPGLQEIIEYVLFAGVFLAAPWVLRLGSHVRVDLVISSLPTRISKFLDRALDLFSLLVCLVLLRYGWANFSQAYEFQSTQVKYFNIPEWWLLTIFVISFFLLSVEFLSRFLRGGEAMEAQEKDAGGL